MHNFISVLIILTVKEGDMNDQLVDILLVEDSEYVIEYLKSLICIDNQLNLKHVSKDCKEAISYLVSNGNSNKEKQPGLVLIDMDISDHQGLELLKNIRNLQKLKNIAVVMLTSNEEDEKEIKSCPTGLHYVIRKPMDYKKIKDTFKEFSLYWGLVAAKPHLAEQLG